MRPNGAFDQHATKTWDRSFWGVTVGLIFKILTLKDFGPLHQWSPSMIYYPFWPTHSRKFRFCLFDQGATKCVQFPNFSPGENITYPNFTPVMRKVSHQDFSPFWAPYGRKLRIGLFDQRATKWCLWPTCDKTWVRSFCGATVGQIFKIFT